MTDDKGKSGIRKPTDAETEKPSTDPSNAKPAKEHGGQEGPDPTRFGDWEKGGRCVDF